MLMTLRALDLRWTSRTPRPGTAGAPSVGDRAGVLTLGARPTGRVKRGVLLGTVVAGALCGALALPGCARARGTLDLAIDEPASSVAAADVGDMLFVSGRAVAPQQAYERFRIIFAMDRSGSTLEASSIDVNGDARIDGRCADAPRGLGFVFRLLRRCKETPDSIFRAELAAARTILSQLDPRRGSVGLIAFSGDRDPATPDAWTLVPLTTDFARVREGLDQLEARGPSGWTNLVAGIDHATRMLIDEPAAGPLSDPESQALILLFSDGSPTLPALKRQAYGRVRLVPDVEQSRRQAALAGRRAADAGVRIDTYVTRLPEARAAELLTELARSTDGDFNPVRRLEGLRTEFSGGAFDEIDQLGLRNRTLDRDAAFVIREPGGRFSALVPVARGENTIAVRARTRDGLEQGLEVRVRILEDHAATPLDPRWFEAREQLLQRWLDELRTKSLFLEAERADRVLDELRQEMAEHARAIERERSLRIEQSQRGIGAE